MQYSIKQTIRIFGTFMWRDTYVYLKDIHTHIINYVILAPIIFGFCFAYLQKNIYFGTHEIERGTCLFLGSITGPLLFLAFKVIVELLLDLEGNRFINYQLGILPARILLVQRIIFASVYTFLLTIPYFPVVKFILGDHLATFNASWFTFIILLYASSLCCASYTMLAMCILSVETLGSFWIRVNWVLMNLGGFWVPLAVIKQFSPFIGLVAYLNPLLYIMEGTRSTILGTAIFISAFYCIIILLAFSLLFTMLSWHFFKKRIDHI